MQRKIRILIVEDETAIRSGLLDLFPSLHGFEVDSAADGREGLRKALGGGFDLMLLDVMLPGSDGFEICDRGAQIRDVPIIMLTAKTSDEDIIHGLTLGADDYVAKPFSVAQLVLRVQAVLRRSRSGQNATAPGLGDDLVDRRKPEGRRGDGADPSPAARWRCCSTCGRLRNAQSRARNCCPGSGVMPEKLNIETRTVDIHIAKLRRKIEPDPANPRYLVTVRGAGYRLVAD